MPIVAFSELPADARLWVFGASRALDADEQARLLAAVDAWLGQWKAHGTPLTSARLLREGQFLVIGVDEAAAGASGCSIDALYRTLAEQERVLGTPLVAGGRVFWRGPDGRVHAGDRAAFTAAAARGEVSRDTPVFDPTVMTRAAFDAAFERPAAAGWHAQLLP